MQINSQTPVEGSLEVLIWRGKAHGRYQHFSVPRRQNQSVLDVVTWVQRHLDPTQNVDGGVRHMRDLLKSFGGDVTLALAAYNAGEAAVRSHGGVPPFAETREYVRRVRALYSSSGSVAPQTVALVTAPQRVYRSVDEDGTVIFTNLPPRSVGTPPNR